MIEVAQLRVSSFGRWTQESEVAFDPSSSELEMFIRKYKALRIALMAEGDKYHLVAMPASSGDHMSLVTYFTQFGMKVNIQTFFHIVDAGSRFFLTIDGFYDPETAYEGILEEYTSEDPYTVDDFDMLLKVVEKLPRSVDCSIVLAAASKALEITLQV